jgi:uncharacterized protein
MVRQEKVSFASGTVPVAGYLFLPEPRTDADARLPTVILAHGFSGTMDRLVPYAERFASSGIAALVFDYRSFGESGGEPRQLVDIRGQHEDIRAAVAWVRGRADLDTDRVALWGNSLGGAHAISVAAHDPRVVAVVAQIPFNGFPRRVEGRSTGAALRLFAALVWDYVRGRLHLSPFYIPMVGKPGELAVTATQEADHHIQTLTGGDATTLWKNEVAPRGLLQMMRYRPALDAARLQAPCSSAPPSTTGRRRSTPPGRSLTPPLGARCVSTQERTSASTPIPHSGNGPSPTSSSSSTSTCTLRPGWPERCRPTTRSASRARSNSSWPAWEVSAYSSSRPATFRSSAMSTQLCSSDGTGGTGWGAIVSRPSASTRLWMFTLRSAATWGRSRR